jgi:hypothetical protein
VLREAPELLLREDQLAVDRDLEDAAGAGDQLGTDLRLPLDRIRQTGGARLVVSNHAVFDRYLHRVSLLGLEPSLAPAAGICVTGA